MNKTSDSELLEEHFDALEILAEEACSEADALPVLKPVETRTNIRQQERYLVRWRMAIVFDEDKGKDTFHGRVNDISMGGISIHCDQNIFYKGNVTLLLAVPPLNVAHSKRILEIKSRVVYTILSKNSFRIGFQFIGFKAGDEEFLEKRLKSNHTLYRDFEPPQE
ncbi:MAG TPA: PilZ domain-containing protein [Sulfuricella sp.]|nr:PilZ domain-containing protein [Sulfuricella sp.]